jgi:hypothetical protein
MMPAALPEAAKIRLSELQLARMAAEDAADEEAWRCA